MKIIATTAMCLCLSACISGGGSSVSGISSPKGATLAGLGNNPAKETAECMSRILKVAVQPDGDGYLLTIASGRYPFTYRVRPIDDKLGRYTTQVDQIGLIPSNPPIIGYCLATGSDPA
jgi:hypothetical protein